jgi:ferredoxin/flavodoxin---NADP+ reductase
MAHYSIAIVGAGPAGYFTAQALQNAQNDDRTFSIDLFERLPTMWGLVRSGVAPDHPKIKTVAKVFEKVAAEPNFRLFGNIEIGKDIDIEDLTARYDAVVMCTGSAIGRKLGIPGEDLPGSISAAEFVPWYNGHPDFAALNIDLSGTTAVVIGAGNVAMDCARMLAINPIELDPTDTANHALATFRNSNIRKVYIAGRRGVEHAAFTAPELRDLPKLEHTDVYIDADQVSEAHARAEAAGEIEKHVESNLEAWRLIAEHPKSGHERSMEFRFLSAPKEIKGKGRVEEVIFGINKIENGKVVDTGETYSIPCSLVISAIGYQAAPINGIYFHNGIIENEAGRVLGTNIYTVGWAKRGPSGVIGTNKSDASDVVGLLISDLKEPKERMDIAMLIPGDHQIINQSAWAKINAAEVAAGEPLGKPRVKEVSWVNLLSLGLN